MRRYNHYIINKEFTLVWVAVKELVYFEWDYVSKGYWRLAENNENICK